MKPLPALLVAISVLPLRAGICSSASGDPRHEFGFFAGYSPASSTLIGTESNRRFVAAGFEYKYRCWIWNSVSVSYSATALPAAILLQPAEVLYNFTPPYQRLSPPHAVYGFAVAPLGFTLELLRKRRWHPFAETIEGLIASTEPIPENQPDASGLNFLFDLGAGVRWSVAPGQAVSSAIAFCTFPMPIPPVLIPASITTFFTSNIRFCAKRNAIKAGLLDRYFCQ